MNVTGEVPVAARSRSRSGSAPSMPTSPHKPLQSPAILVPCGKFVVEFYFGLALLCCSSPSRARSRLLCIHGLALPRIAAAPHCGKPLSACREWALGPQVKSSSSGQTEQLSSTGDTHNIRTVVCYSNSRRHRPPQLQRPRRPRLAGNIRRDTLPRDRLQHRRDTLRRRGSLQHRRDMLRRPEPLRRRPEPPRPRRALHAPRRLPLQHTRSRVRRPQQGK